MDFISTYIFIIGLFTPYLGIHWQANKSVTNYKINKCFAEDTNKKNCVNSINQVVDIYLLLKIIRDFFNLIRSVPCLFKIRKVPSVDWITI